MESIQLKVTGMKCGGCVNTVEKILNNSDGIDYVSVNLLTESAYFEITQKHIEIETVLENLKQNGFPSKIYINDFSKNFDGICMSYGLRNLNNVEEGIKKVFDLLKDKGRAGFLDFNHSTRNSLSNIFQKIYLRLIVVTISRLFNLGPEYAYIEKSISNFPKKNELIIIAKEVGFKKAEYRTILGGQMGILILVK